MGAPSQVLVLSTSLLFLSPAFLIGISNGQPSQQTVDIDLQKGIVQGYSSLIKFIVTPQQSFTTKCDAQAVVRIDFTGAYKMVRFNLQYSTKPRLWTVNIADSKTSDGYGGDNGTTSNMAEMQIHNQQLRMYGNALPGYQDESIDGTHLVHVVDDVIDKDGKLSLEVSDERVGWTIQGKSSSFESKYLFTLSGQNTTYGAVDYFLYAGFNRVVSSNFRSGSGLCKVQIVLSGETADDTVDKCSKVKQSRCHDDAICLNTRRAYRCRCKPGFYGNGKICVDYNECEYETGGCVHSCTNIHGNYSCSCKRGFTLADDNHNCIDINECQNRHPCQHQCENLMGSFRCKCNRGYTLLPDGVTCKYGSQCPLDCDHHCDRSGRRLVCGCRKGYKLHSNGRNCIRSCAAGNGGCQHTCEDSPTGPVCGCHVKYKLAPDRKTCVATCRVENGGCDRRCHDTVDGPKCSCPPGFVLHKNKKKCIDIDECAKNKGGCSHSCVNTHGSFECICPIGFQVMSDQKTCTDIDECQFNQTCDHICKNTHGSYQCYCRVGYEKYGISHCGDRNECSMGNGGCAHKCVNEAGTFQCTCRQGYRLHSNKKDCVEAKHCPSLTPPAKATLYCQVKGSEEICQIRCLPNAEFSANPREAIVRCGPNTRYEWLSRADNNTATLPACSESIAAPGYKKRARFRFSASVCQLHKEIMETFKDGLSQVLLARKKYRCTELCQVNFVNLQCGQRRLIHRHLMPKQVRADFELEVSPKSPTNRCNIRCIRRRTEKRLKRTMRRLKHAIDKNQFKIRFDGEVYEVTKRSFRADQMEATCRPGQVLVEDKCVSCSHGSYFDTSTRRCQSCPLGAYQDEEGQLSCKLCPQGVGLGIHGAKNVSECAGQCDPGHYSSSGFKPCTKCPVGTYQADHGRTHCLSCGKGVLTASTGSTGFQQCLVKERCKAGHYFSTAKETCLPCNRTSYQHSVGQNFCIDCPKNTNTDHEGATSSDDCKARTCGGQFGKFQGFIQSPNWPGDYPSNVACNWTIKPDKGRRILIVIPGISISEEDKCGDSLSMRRSSSPYSLVTFETCESTTTPIAFTARTRRLFIQFKSNAINNAKGFSVPYVTYNEEYQELIEDIVRDGRLYSSHKHQEVLKDRNLLSFLLEVIAQPYNYFRYANQSRAMFPESFIRILTQKVKKFFSR